jgi:NACalpha-BTF3-like transcription factor
MKALKKNSEIIKKLSPFDFLNSINDGPRGTDLLKGCLSYSSESLSVDSPDKEYVPFIVNRGLSYFQDTILFANAMNESAHIPSKMQYDFLRNAIKPRKRFSKWSKKIDDSDDVKLIMNRYGYSAEKARDALKIFCSNPDKLDQLKSVSSTGGISKKK